MPARPSSPVHLIFPDSLTVLTQTLPPKNRQHKAPKHTTPLLCMAADRALDALGVRGASGGPSYCWPPPAAPPHQQVPTWGRPIHEVGAVGRRGEVERGGGGIGRRGGRLHTNPSHSSFLLPSCGTSCGAGGEERRSLSGLAHTALHWTVGSLLTHPTALMHPLSSDSQLIPASTRHLIFP